MKVLSLKEFGTMAVEHREIPVPGPGEALIRVAATGICGSDIHGYTGHNGRRFLGQVMGHESAGWIESFADSAPAGLSVGDPVTFNPLVIPEEDLEEYAGREQHHPNKQVIGVYPQKDAAFAEYLTVPVRNIVALPPGYPVEYGALVEPLAVALHALRRAQVSGQDRLLILGGGPIGQSLVVAARIEGVENILVTEISEVRRQLITQLGAQTVALSETTNLSEAVTQQWKQLADVTIDAVGVNQTLRDAFSATKLGGTICLVGMGQPEVTVEAYRISTDERSVIGSFTYTYKDFTDATTWLQREPQLFELLISQRVSVDEGPSAFAELAAPNAIPGKVLVQFSSEK